jgi:hypothetical protein
MRNRGWRDALNSFESQRVDTLDRRIKLAEANIRDSQAERRRIMMRCIRRQRREVGKS